MAADNFKVETKVRKYEEGGTTVVIVENQAKDTFRVCSFDQKTIYGAFANEFALLDRSHVLDACYSPETGRAYLCGTDSPRFTCYDTRSKALLFRKELPANCWLYNWRGNIVALPYLNNVEPMLFDPDGNTLAFPFPKGKMWYRGVVLHGAPFVATELRPSSVHNQWVAHLMEMSGSCTSFSHVARGYFEPRVVAGGLFMACETDRTMWSIDGGSGHWIEASGVPYPAYKSVRQPGAGTECSHTIEGLAALVPSGVLQLPMDEKAMPTPTPTKFGHASKFHDRVQHCESENVLLLDRFGQSLWQVFLPTPASVPPSSSAPSGSDADGLEAPPVLRIAPVADCARMWF